MDFTGIEPGIMTWISMIMNDVWIENELNRLWEQNQVPLA